MMDLQTSLAQIEKQNSQLKDRVSILTSMEGTYKKELEEHVDVLLKME